MAQFNAEIFDTGLLQTKKKKSIVSKLFHSEKSLPEDAPQARSIFAFHEDSSDYESEEERPRHSIKDFLTFNRKKLSGTAIDKIVESPTGDVEKRDSVHSMNRKSSVKSASIKSGSTKSDSKKLESKSRKDSSSSLNSDENSHSKDSLFRKRGSVTGSGSIFKDLLMPSGPRSGRRGSVGSTGSAESSLSRTSSEISLEEKYGCTDGVLGIQY